MELQYRKATPAEAERVYYVAQTTIAVIYPKFYIQEVVDFFGRLHSIDNIRKDIDEGKIFVLIKDEIIIGTGSYSKNHITRVYILPEFQGQGFGSFIMENLEKDIFSKYDFCELEASLPACLFYENRGYRSVKHKRYDISNGLFMIYEIMRKENLR